MSVLMWRRAQTIGELKARCDRQFSFVSTDEVAAVLGDLAQRAIPLTRQLERQPGQKDARWIHLLSPTIAQPGDPSMSADVVDVTGVDDPYGEAAAEYYDLLATDMWDTFGVQLLGLLADVDPSVGPLIDIGCGTGVGLDALCAAVPGVRLHAIEPSKAMRTALHTRLAGNDALRVATTVVPASFGDAPLPPAACGIVVSATLGHLTDHERERLWRYVAEQMPAGAPAVIGVLPPDRPVDVPLVRYRQLAVGDFIYEGWQQGEPIDDRNMMWTLIYKVLAGDDVVAEHSVRSRWRCDGADDVRREIAPFGLELVEHDDCVVVSRRSV